MDFVSLFMAGVNSLIEYVSAHVLTCLIPAFFIAGAMSALLPKEKIAQYLGQNVSKFKAYPLAVIAGLLLAVCSCTILPLFAGIKKKGAGLGPALTFLYTAPATNIIAITFTGSVLGWNFAIARIVLSVTFAILIGLIISSMFKEEDSNEKKMQVDISHPKEKSSKKKPFFQKHRLILLFILLVGILIAGTRLSGNIKWGVIGGLIILLVILAKFHFSKEEIKAWLSETWMFTKKIFPILLIGIFIAGILSSLLSQNFLVSLVGDNSIFSNLIAVLFGVFMYFPTLVEVPMANLFLSLGMAKGPLLAYLLADPVISLASILVIRKLIGTKRTLVYVGLIIIFSTIAGLIYGSIV